MKISLSILVGVAIGSAVALVLQSHHKIHPFRRNRLGRCTTCGHRYDYRYGHFTPTGG